MKRLFIVTIAIFCFANLYSQTAGEFIEKSKEKSDMKDYEGAIIDYTKAIELKPDYILAYYLRGEARYILEDYPGAIVDYTRVIELKPNYIDVFFSRARAKSLLEDYRGAISDYTKAIELKPDFEYAYYNNRGLAKSSLKDYRGAIMDYTKAIELKPDFDYAYFNRGLCEIEINLNNACLDFSRAGELGHSEAYEMIKKYCN